MLPPVGSKVKLAGALTVTERTCECCQGKDMLNLIEDKITTVFYCRQCFVTDCSCHGKQVKIEDK